MFQEYTPERKFYTNENQDSGYDLRFAGEIDHSFCNSLDAGEYLSAALYNGGYYGRWPDCRCGGLAALGAVDFLLWVVTGISTGLTQGFSIQLAQYYGAKDLKSAKISGTQLSADRIHRSGVFILSQSFASLVLTGLHTPSNIIGMSLLYLRIIFCGISGYCSFIICLPLL